jgi:hypothetical protein
MGLMEKPTLIEQTDKRYKKLIVAGYLLFFIGVIICFSAFSETVAKSGISIGTMMKMGGTTTLTGFLIACLGKFLAWWEHG